MKLEIKNVSRLASVTTALANDSALLKKAYYNTEQNPERIKRIKFLSQECDRYLNDIYELAPPETQKTKVNILTKSNVGRIPALASAINTDSALLKTQLYNNMGETANTNEELAVFIESLLDKMYDEIPNEETVVFSNKWNEDWEEASEENSELLTKIYNEKRIQLNDDKNFIFTDFERENIKIFKEPSELVIYHMAKAIENDDFCPVSNANYYNALSDETKLDVVKNYMSTSSKIGFQKILNSTLENQITETPKKKNSLKM
jgi:hypothetical protein